MLTGWRVSVCTHSRSIRIYPAYRNASAEAANQLQIQDLENALAEADLNESLSDYVVRETWKLINAADLRFLGKSVGTPNVLPLGRLYRYLFNSTQRDMAVVTTNYDRLAEYAADFSGLSHYTGFTYGYLRRRQSGSLIYFSQEM